MIAIRPAITYEIECWSIKKEQMHRMTAVEMKMLRWIDGKIRKDRIRNEHFREHLEVATIDDKLRDTHLRWLGRVECRLATSPLKKSFSMQVDGS